jgi:hypothetical protein
MVRRLVLVLVFVLASPVMLALPAHAAKKQDFCTVVANLGQATSGQTFGQDAKGLAKAFKRAGKKSDAPKKVNKAMRTLGSFYDQAADADNAADYVRISSQFGARYANASLTFSQHYVSECLTPLLTPTTAGSTGTTTTSSSSTTTSSASSSGGVAAGVINGAPATAQLSSCSASAASGSARNADGSFQLTWTGNSGTLTWRSGSNTYSGAVQVQVLGPVATFTGNAGGSSVFGTASCG